MVVEGWFWRVSVVGLVNDGNSFQLLRRNFRLLDFGGTPWIGGFGGG